MARPTRFERATSTFGGWHSIQLSYGREEGAKHSRFGVRRPLHKGGVSADGLGAAWNGDLHDGCHASQYPRSSSQHQGQDSLSMRLPGWFRFETLAARSEHRCGQRPGGCTTHAIGVADCPDLQHFVNNFLRLIGLTCFDHHFSGRCDYASSIRNGFKRSSGRL